jgi:cytochrome b561
MSITRPDGSYSAVAKIFHWVSVPLIVLALLVNVVMAWLQGAGTYRREAA